MRYFKQNEGFSCGPACARMMLHSLGLEVSEAALIDVMGASPDHGTPRENWTRLADYYHLNMIAREEASLDEIVALKLDGWQITLLIMSDVPHYVGFLGVRDGRVYMHDPWDTPNYNLLIRNFLRKWQITAEKWHHDSIYISHHWFVAVKLLPQ